MSTLREVGKRFEEVFKILGAIAAVALSGACAWGWILNIIDVVHTMHDPLTGLFLLRAIGIFIFPLGIILGFFT